nr:sigma 54-interacting transcriptional regulator [candidate division Zixibacteria bacterium]
MSLTSHQNASFDTRLLEIEELYRQRKPDLAGEQLKALAPDDFKSEGFERGLYLLLQATDQLHSGNYKESIRLGLEANKLLASSAFHLRVGQLFLLLYRNYSGLGDFRNAERYAQDALAFLRRADDSIGMVGALNGLGKLAYIRGDFSKSIEFITEAIELSRGDNIRMAELIGNLGRIELLAGGWQNAEDHLGTALKLAGELNQPLSIARGYLSLGHLYLRQRKFNQSAQEFRAAEILIEANNYRRDRIIMLELEGELAFELGDMIQARKVLTRAFDLGRELAPESALITQITRRMAQVELALDNLDEALTLAQRALDLAARLGEKAEIGLSRMIIAEIFSARDNNPSAFEYSESGLEILREVGDPYDLGRALLIQARIASQSKTIGLSKIDKLFDEAFRIFNQLKLFYWSAETRFRQGILCCQYSRISSGFRNLLESEKIFENISEKAKIRSVRLFKQELSKIAVTASLSADNEFKIFGDYFTETEYSNLKTGQIQNIIDILSQRTRASRVIIYKAGQQAHDALTNLDLTQLQRRRFIQQFDDLLGEEFNPDKPTLILDSRRDPFINDLLQPGGNEVISSVMVIPLMMGKQVSGYVYLDRLSSNGDFRPFGQKELNFAVSFADLISLKMAEYEKFLLEEENRRLKSQLMEEAAFPNIITQNKQMLEMLARVQQVVNSNISISIEGETGSGKDLLAKTIHYSSNRKDRRFISVNCAALPETLLESELFGHKKGAFTGADRDKTGLFEEANGGTFFLDEIADMPLSIQAKVLRILEEKEIVRLGETRPIKVDVRIISATNKDLKVEMEAGRFRQDLYYRLTALCFKIPPLRERREDIPLLIDHFAEEKVKFAPEVLRKLITFDWPGNVRELENEIKKLILLTGEKGIVDVKLLSGKILDREDREDSYEMTQPSDVNFDAQFSLYDYLAQYERRFIIKALREQGGVKKHAAAILNIPESTLRLKIKQYNIDLKNLSISG